jgi:hypothetical protein
VDGGVVGAQQGAHDGQAQPGAAALARGGEERLEDLLASGASVFLVVSYLRLVVSPRFAYRRAALAQLVYQVRISGAPGRRRRPDAGSRRR